MNVDDWSRCQFCGVSYPDEEGRRCECPDGDAPDPDASMRWHGGPGTLAITLDAFAKKALSG
jgi:hypothetical protein